MATKEQSPASQQVGSGPPAARPPARLGRALLYILAGLVAFVVACAINERVQSGRERRELAPVGKLVDAGGRTLLVRCEGAVTPGRPAIILEAGLTDWSIAWSLVQPELSKTHRVCSYDRAGNGASDPGEFTVERVFADLERVMAESGAPPPYVLVGHSAGGLLLRLYAGAHPDRVKGLALVDAAQPEMLPVLDTEPAPFRQLILTSVGDLGIARALIAVIGLDAMVQETSFLSDETKRRYVAGIRKRFHTMPGERAMFLDALRRAQAENDKKATLGDLPLVVITGHLGTDPRSERWLAFQKELPKLSTRSRHVVLEHVGHYVQFAKPEAVIEAAGQLAETSFPTTPPTPAPSP